LLDLVKEGKVVKVVFEDLSRVGRTLKDTINIMSTLVDDHNIQVTIRNLNLESHIDGKPNPIWNLMVGVMGSIYQLDRDRILEVTEQGRRQYVLDGGKLGRPSESTEPKKKFINKPQSKRILSLLRKGKGNNDIIGRINCSPKTVTKVKRIAKELELI
jgi:DNA invertase Pin-like site-specific DNA recombinase